MIKYTKCFDDEFDKDKSYSVLDAGLRVIKVKRITGTVDKCGELDKKFRYIKRHDVGERSRQHQLMQAAEKFSFFPAIDVILYKGEYFVIDGNRRTSVAIALGMDFIDANVKEYIHKEGNGALSGAIYRRRFEGVTDLKNIDLSIEAGYKYLIDEVSAYTPDKNNPGSGKMWYTQQFLPACSEIKRSRLPDLYPDISTSDIYVLVMRFYKDILGEDHVSAGRGSVGFQAMISSFMFAHKLKRKRIYRLFPFRMLGSFFYRQGRKKDGFPS